MREMEERVRKNEKEGRVKWRKKKEGGGGEKGEKCFFFFFWCGERTGF